MVKKNLDSGLQVDQVTPLCQLQDLGRWGYKQYGVTHSGAMDKESLRIANMLVGNPEGTAGLEFTLAGGEFTLTAHSLKIAFVGDFPLWINGEEQESYTSLHMHRGDRLSIGSACGGIRGYLAVAGGFRIKKELGSASEHSRSGLGGFSESIGIGKILPTRLNYSDMGRHCFLPPRLRPVLSNVVRVMPGPQWDHFSEQGQQTFLSGSFKVSNQADRMGYRLTGPKIEHSGSGNIISDPVLMGSIQVPADGHPLVLMADGPTTGGYPKIATVITVDLGKIAQLGPQSEVTFEMVTLEQAQGWLLEQKGYFARLSQRVDIY